MNRWMVEAARGPLAFSPLAPDGLHNKQQGRHSGRADSRDAGNPLFMETRGRPGGDMR